MTVADGKFKITRSDGLWIDLDGEPGGDADYIVTSAGLYDQPDIATNDQNTIHGEVGGADVMGGRAMALDVDLAWYGRKPTDEVPDPLAEAYLDREYFEAFLDPSHKEFLVEWGVFGIERARRVRSRGVPSGPNAPHDGASLTAMFRALDATTYGEERSIEVEDSEEVDGGGYRASRFWTATIEGPVTGPVITYTAAGGVQATLDFPTLTVASGRSLVLEFRGPLGTPSARVIGEDYELWVTGAARDEHGGLARWHPWSNGERLLTYGSDTGGSALFEWRDGY